MLNLYYSSRFKKDYKRMIKRGVDTNDFEKVVNMLVCERVLPEKYRDRNLSGIYEGFRECHINPDWLLIYRVEKDRLILTLSRMGTQSDLF